MCHYTQYKHSCGHDTLARKAWCLDADRRGNCPRQSVAKEDVVELGYWCDECIGEIEERREGSDGEAVETDDDLRKVKESRRAGKRDARSSVVASELRKAGLLPLKK